MTLHFDKRDFHNRNLAGLTLGQWLEKVDSLCWGKFGCSRHDLPDQPWADWYDNEYSPREAIHEVEL